MTIAVITAITGSKDRLRHDQCWGSAEWLAFVDAEAGECASLWQPRLACNLFRCPNRNAKIHKVLAHAYSDADCTIWLDGNIALTMPPEELVDVMGEADLALFRHPERDCIYEEFSVSRAMPKYDALVMAAQVDHYRKLGYPPHAGLWECGVIVRRNNERTREFANRWWAEICRWSTQDQLSFPVAAAGMAIMSFPGSIRHNSTPFTDYRSHAKG